MPARRDELLKAGGAAWAFDNRYEPSAFPRSASSARQTSVRRYAAWFWLRVFDVAATSARAPLTALLDGSVLLASFPIAGAPRNIAVSVGRIR